MAESPTRPLGPRFAADDRDGAALGLHPALVLLRERTQAAAADARRPRRTRLLALAAAWSHAASPPVTALAATVLTAATLTGPWPWIWASVHVVVAVAFPFAVLVAMHRRGEILDLELPELRQRQGPLLLAFLTSGTSLFMLETAVAPAPLVRLVLAYTVLGLLLLAVSRHWQISVHAAGVAVVGTVLWRAYGAPLWLVAGVLSMGGARVALGRHTVAQVVAGALAGMAAALVFAC